MFRRFSAAAATSQEDHDSLAQAFFPARQGEAGVDRAFALESRDVHTVIPWQTLPDKTQVAVEVG